MKPTTDSLNEAGLEFREAITRLNDLCRKFEDKLKAVPGRVEASTPFGPHLLRFARYKSDWRLFIDETPLTDAKTELRVLASLEFPALFVALENKIKEKTEASRAASARLDAFLKELEST